MANYTIPENPQYTAEIRKLENTDPANAETILNPLVETLIGNTHAVKLEADKKANSSHTHLPGDCGLGKNLTFTGAATGTYNGQAPASFLIPDRKGCRFIVGTSTNGWTEKDCDYLCDGTADQVEINNAISALPSTGGEVVVLAGTYNITASITVNKSNVKLRGNGDATVLKRMWNGTSSNGVIQVTSNYCCIEGFYIDGNRANYTNIWNIGIYLYNSKFNTITGNTCNSNTNCGIYLSTSSNNNTINGNICSNNNDCGINLNNSSTNNTITGNTCNSNTNCGIYLYSTNNNTVTGNTCSSNTNYGIYLFATSTSNTVTGNTCNNNNYGIILRTSSNNNTITGNTCSSNTNYGICLYSTNNNTVTGNTCYDNQSGIVLAGGTSNNITGNTIYRESYTSSQYSISLSSGNNNLIADNLIWGKNYTNGGTNNTFVNNKYN